MVYYHAESFFRPQAVCKHISAVPAHLFNQFRLLFIKTKGDCVFVPVRNMQYQAIVTEDEVIFIDSLGHYALNHLGEGGRMIDIAWHWDAQSRDSLSAPVSLNLTFYRPKLDDIQRQLLGAFPAALKAKLNALDRHHDAAQHCRIMPFLAPNKDQKKD